MKFLVELLNNCPLPCGSASIVCEMKFKRGVLVYLFVFILLFKSYSFTELVATNHETPGVHRFPVENVFQDNFKSCYDEAFECFLDVLLICISICFLIMCVCGYYLCCAYVCICMCVFNIWSYEAQFVHCNIDILTYFFLYF